MVTPFTTSSTVAAFEYAQMSTASPSFQFQWGKAWTW